MPRRFGAYNANAALDESRGPIPPTISTTPTTAVISNWTLDTFKVDPTPLFTCAEARTAGSANRAGFCDPAVDALIERGLRTTDAGAAKQTWAEFSRLLQERQPITFLFWSEDLAGVGMRVQGMVTDVRSKIANIDRWWIPESRRR